MRKGYSSFHLGHFYYLYDDNIPRSGRCSFYLVMVLLKLINLIFHIKETRGSRTASATGLGVYSVVSAAEQVILQYGFCDRKHWHSSMGPVVSVAIGKVVLPVSTVP